MASGKETFTKAIEFMGPEYLPSNIGVDFNFLYDKDPKKTEIVKNLMNSRPKDNEGFLGCHLDKEVIINNVRYTDDEWGVKWLDAGHGNITTYHPMEEGYEHIVKVCFPDASNEKRFAKTDTILKNRGDKYIAGIVWNTLFERLWMLRGFNNMLMDPYLEETGFLALKEKIMEVNLALIDKWIERKVDAIYFSDDWGSQRSLMINPQDWRKYYKNDYKKLFDKVKSANIHVWMHLCGNITAILPDLIDMGLNVLNPVQPQAMDIAQLSKQFGGSVCFNGGVDVQGTMINGSPTDVKNEFRRLVELFGSFNGGYIAGTSHSIMPETPLDNVIALFEVLAEYR